MYERFTARIEGRPAFSKRQITTGSGTTKKKRIIHEPNDAMREVHRRLQAVIGPVLECLPERSVITGCVPGVSVRDNAATHAKRRFVYTTDLRNAFGNVDHNRLGNILAELVDDKDNRLWPEVEAAAFIRRYCADGKRGLVLGGPAVPALFNIYLAKVLDAKLIPYCEAAGITYTRYVDDLTFSSDEPIGKMKRLRIRTFVTEAGFEVNHRKSDCIDLYLHSSVVITGVRLELGGRMTPTRASMEQARDKLHQAKQGEISLPRGAGHMSMFFTINKRPGRPPNARERRLLKQYIETVYP